MTWQSAGRPSTQAFFDQGAVHVFGHDHRPASRHTGMVRMRGHRRSAVGIAIAECQNGFGHQVARRFVAQVKP